MADSSQPVLWSPEWYQQQFSGGKPRPIIETGQAANQFAEWNQGQAQNLSAESATQRDYLRRLMSGQDSVSAEQLRQGLQQNLAAQRSMAASASPGNQAMAARNAAMNMGRMGYGMAGQQAVAGLQERQQAQQALAQMLMQERGQDMTGALGSRQTAVSAYQAGQLPQKSFWGQYGPAIGAGLGYLAGGPPGAAAGSQVASDERLKADIEPDDDKASAVLEGLRAYRFKYRDPKHGRGEQYGVMAQELERAGLKHTVIDTPSGKMVDGAKLAASNTAMLSTLGRRLSKLERKAG